MSRAHRSVIVASAALWSVTIGLMFTQLLSLPDPWSDFWRAASVNAGALAACLTTVAVLPWFLRDFYKTTMVDLIGVYLAGWAKESQDVEPEETAKLTLLG